MAGRVVPGIALLQLGFDLSTQINCPGAARRKPAAGGQIDLIGNLSADFRMLPFNKRVRDGNSRHERPGVGMAGLGHNPPGGADLHNLSQIKDGNPVAQIADGGKIMGNVENGNSEFPAQLFDQVQYAGSYGDVKHGDRFVSDQQLWLKDDGSGDGNTLALATAQFMGEAVDILLGWP